MLLDTIKSDLRVAMKNGDKEKLSCLRMVISAIKYRELATREELDDREVIQVLRSQIKQTTDSYEQYTQGGRDDLAQKEQTGLMILRSYLPKELGEEEIAAMVKQIISETAATKKDFGKVMKLVMAKVAGQAEGKTVNGIVNKLLP